MTEFRALQFVTMAALVVAAWLFCSKQRSHVAFAAYATWMAAMDWARLGLAAVRRGHEHPLHGLARAAYHAEQAIVVSWSLFFLACCLHYYARRLVWVPLAVWMVISVGLVVAYPTGTRSFALLYTTSIYYVVTAASWAVIVYGALFDREIRVELAHIMIAVYAAVDVVVIAVPLARADMGNWPVVRAASSLAAAGMVVAHIVVFARGRLGPPTAARGE
jgi:hypothetical protein